MKILVLSSERPGGYPNDPIHRGFFESAPHPVAFYGPNETRGPAFRKERRMADVVREAKADLVLVNMKKRVRGWLDPKQLADLHVPKAVIEVDFCYERKNQSWYAACGLDVLFLRHKSDVSAATHPRKRWLPFSLKPSWIAVPARGERRPQDVGFAGALAPISNYPARNRAVKLLGTRLTRPTAKVIGEAYMTWWRRFRVGLTCSCVWRYDNAKHLIIPGAGALVLTDGSAGTADLLPKDTYVLYKTDGSDLVRVLDAALTDPHLLERRRAGAAHVAQHHTHAKRWTQLLQHMESVRRV